MAQLEMYRFFVRYKDNADNMIPEERRNAFVREIKLKCCEVNGGFRVYEGSEGMAWKGAEKLTTGPAAAGTGLGLLHL